MVENLPQLLSLFGLGFLLGLRHAFDADHVVAVSTLMSQTRSFKKSSIFGITWGVGHTLTLALTALVVLLFKVTIPEELAQTFEFAVGVLLVILGLNVFYKLLRGEVHVHEHVHEDGSAHVHLHAHDGPGHHGRTIRSSLLIGMLHGLAGSSALLLLVLTTIESVTQGLLFVLVFGIGSILGMFMTTTAMALPLRYAARFGKLNRALQMSIGAVSIVLGIAIMVQIGIPGRLLGG